jgi:hypothetical protein
MVGARPRFLLLILLVSLALTAWSQSFDAPARALAQKIASALKMREPVVFSFSNVAAASPSDAAAARDAIVNELHALGISTGAPSGVAVVVTLSENFRGWVWVAEIRRNDTREVVMEEWPRQTETGIAAPVLIEKQRVLDQDLCILDFAPLGRDLLVLDAESVSIYENSSGAWQHKLSIRIPVSRSLPRDLRGRLFVQGEVYQAYLPGLTCDGNAAGGLSITCRDEGLWPLGPNVRGISIPTRNFFENFVLPDGLQKHMPAFFSAASFSDHGRAAWIFAGTDGRTHLYNAAFESGASWAGWGSDIAAVENECGSRTLLLATGTGDSTAPDAVQAYELADGAPRPMGDPVSFPGPVTALWPASERGAAVAVSRDLKSGRYAAFRLSIPCSR